jgi:hypothetical protein
MPHEDKNNRPRKAWRQSLANSGVDYARDLTAIIVHAQRETDQPCSCANLSPKEVERSRDWEQGRVWHVINSAVRDGFVGSVRWDEQQETLSFELILAEP